MMQVRFVLAAWLLAVLIKIYIKTHSLELLVQFSIDSLFTLNSRKDGKVIINNRLFIKARDLPLKQCDYYIKITDKKGEQTFPHKLFS